jgi:AcrR family transcriptional regulator
VARPRTVSDEKILEATRAAVRLKGPSVSLDAIAERVGLSQPALLKRFKTRNKLFIAALKPPQVPPFLARIEAGPDDRPLKVQLEELFQQMADFFDDVAPCISALRESGIPPSEVDSKPFGLHTLNALIGWLQRANEKGLAEVPDPEGAAVAALASIFMPAMLTHHLGKRTWKRDARQMVQPMSSLWAKAFQPAVRAVEGPQP